MGRSPRPPRVGTPRKIGAPAMSQDLVGKGGCTAAGRAARSKAQGQPDLSEGCVRRDDDYKVPQAHFYVEIADRAPLPRIGEGGRGCGAERRQWRMQRGGAPVAVEKIEKASSAKIFRAPQGGRGKCCRRLPLECICAQCGFRFFDREKSKSVASTAKRQRGLQRGKPGSPLPCFASFCRSKRKAPAASGANYAFAKGSATPLGEMKLYTGNLSVTAAPCQLPLHRGASRAVCRRRRNEIMS